MMGRRLSDRLMWLAPCFVCLLVIVTVAAVDAAAPPVVEIGSRRELFVDEFIIDTLQGAQLRLHHPTPREVAITYDAPNEGNTSSYVRVFADGDRFRMYYRGSHYDWPTGKDTHQVTCYAESTDAIHWTRPELDLFEFNGSKRNNIVWTGRGAHNFAPFKDTNPACKADARYKAVGGSDAKGLHPFGSPDGIHWRRLSDKPVITEGRFDSQNVAFWDAVRGRYVDFHRAAVNKVRSIRTCTSNDFLHWSATQAIDLGDAEPQHLYTNATIAYERAPHIFLSFPKRFVPSRPQAYQPRPEHDFPGVSDGVLMASRDGVKWNRWDEAFLRPGQNVHRWWQRNNEIAWGLLTTVSDLPDKRPELSLYATENYYNNPCRLRRFTLRVDGFVSVNASYKGGQVTTVPLRFQGNELEINYATSAAGSVRCALLDESGAPLEGYALEDCEEIYGDQLGRVVRWKGSTEVGALAGKTLRLQVALRDADLYSFRFR